MVRGRPRHTTDSYRPFSRKIGDFVQDAVQDKIPSYVREHKSPITLTIAVTIGSALLTAGVLPRCTDYVRAAEQRLIDEPQDDRLGNLENRVKALEDYQLKAKDMPTQVEALYKALIEEPSPAPPAPPSKARTKRRR